jgi:DNA-binding GntR family transcriptional regulator
MILNLNIDRLSPVPLHRQVAQSIEEAIHDGRLPRGQRLESELALTTRLRLSRPTVRQALDSLVRQGLLVRKRGVGTQVVGGPIRRSVQLTGLHEDLSGLCHAPTTVVTSFSWERPPADVTEALQLSLDVDVPAFVQLTDGHWP